MMTVGPGDRRLVMVPRPGYEPEIGRWLWALEDVRRVLKSALAGTPPPASSRGSRPPVSAAVLDRQPPGSNGIGTLLYHIAVIEADWLYEDVLGSSWDPAILAFFPHPVRTSSGQLAPVADALATHLRRLDEVRAVFLGHFAGMSLEDWRTPRPRAEYAVSPEWVVYHLLEHEAHHRGQIFDLLRGEG
jgi:uncharacterized damage-inducible protein DinB